MNEIQNNSDIEEGELPNEPLPKKKIKSESGQSFIKSPYSSESSPKKRKKYSESDSEQLSDTSDCIQYVQFNKGKKDKKNQIPLKKQTKSNGSHKYKQNKKSLCDNFLNKRCELGEKCPHSHNIRDYPCKFQNALGKCDKQESCKFSHQKLKSEQEIDRFIKQNEAYLFDLYFNKKINNFGEQFVKYYQSKTQQAIKSQNSQPILSQKQQQYPLGAPPFHTQYPQNQQFMQNITHNNPQQQYSMPPHFQQQFIQNYGPQNMQRPFNYSTQNPIQQQFPQVQQYPQQTQQNVQQYQLYPPAPPQFQKYFQVNQQNMNQNQNNHMKPIIQNSTPNMPNVQLYNNQYIQLQNSQKIHSQNSSNLTDCQTNLLHNTDLNQIQKSSQDYQQSLPINHSQHAKLNSSTTSVVSVSPQKETESLQNQDDQAQKKQELLKKIQDSLKSGSQAKDSNAILNLLLQQKAKLNQKQQKQSQEDVKQEVETDDNQKKEMELKLKEKMNKLGITVDQKQKQIDNNLDDKDLLKSRRKDPRLLKKL